LRPSGNTPPANSTQQGVSPLLCGIDGVYLGYYGQVPRSLYEVLSKCGYAITISGMKFSVKYVARGTYGVVLSNEFLTISLGNSAPSPYSPSIYIQVKSQFIWSAGLQEVYEQILRIVNDIYDDVPEREQVSRVDLFADIAWSKQFEPEDIKNLITRARSKFTHYEGQRISGFTIGKGKVTARIYDKTLEIRKSGKDWLYDLWGIEKDNQNHRVWRVEFQLRREALKEFGIETFDDLLTASQALWNYCTSKWLSVRAAGNKNARRGLVGFWGKVQAANLKLGDDSSNLVRRERMRSGMTEKQAADQMAGITKSYARSHGIDSHSKALDRLIPRVRERLI
jgi:hypothetical protein